MERATEGWGSTDHNLPWGNKTEKGQVQVPSRYFIDLF